MIYNKCIFIILFLYISKCKSAFLPEVINDPTPLVFPDLTLVRFLYWNRNYVGDNGYFLLESHDELNLLDSGFDGSLNTYFFYHGYTDVGTKQWILDAKTKHLQLEDCNVISVDYGALVPSPNYAAAVSNMYNVSTYTASLIDWLVEEGGASPDRIHLIGHSLGSHAAGMTAYYVTTGQIDRITGLDPAGPLFYNKTSDERLDKSQAHFVDIIHTNGCSIGKGCSGIFEPLGHADFYPNGGAHQAGCSALTDPSTGCSHQRVTSLWTESMDAGSVSNPNTFVSWPCTDYDNFTAGMCTTCSFNCLEMGFQIQRQYADYVDNLYYLNTDVETPYAIGNSQASVEV